MKLSEQESVIVSKSALFDASPLRTHSTSHTSLGCLFGLFQVTPLHCLNVPRSPNITVSKVSPFILNYSNRSVCDPHNTIINVSQVSKKKKQGDR